MFEYHITAKGERIMICQMADSHLINTIKMYCRKLTIARKAAEVSGGTEYEKKLYGFKSFSVDDLVGMTKEFAKKLEPYIIELALRGLIANVTKDLQEAFDRKTAVIPPIELKKLQNEFFPQLFSGDDDEEENLDSIFDLEDFGDK